MDTPAADPRGLTGAGRAVHLHVQHPAEPLKTRVSQTPVPVPAALAAELSPQGPTSRPSRHGWGTPASRPPSMPTGTSGPTATSPPGPLSRPCSPPERNRGGTAHSAH